MERLGFLEHSGHGLGKRKAISLSLKDQNVSVSVIFGSPQNEVGLGGSFYQVSRWHFIYRLLLIDTSFLETNSGLHNWQLQVVAKILRGTIKTIVKQGLGDKGKILGFLLEETSEPI